MPHRALLVAGATLLTATLGAQSPERRTLGGDAAIYAPAGALRVVAGSGRDVVVDVTRRGRDADKLRLETGDVRGRQALRVVYPDDDIVYPAIGRSRMRTRINRDGTFGDGGGRWNGGDQVEIRGSGRGTEAWTDMTISVPTGRRVAVHLLAGDAQVTNVDGDLMIDVGEAEVTTTGTRGRLNIDAGSGRVRIANARGEIDIDAGSGDIDLRDVDGREIRVDGGSGGITGSNLKADLIDLDMGSGGTRIDRVSARSLHVDAGSGGVDIGLLTDVDDVKIDVGSGGVTLRIPPTLGASLDIDTGSGGIETEIPIQVTRRERDRLVGSIGDGKGRIDIEGGSGRVRLLKN